ncbi:DUF4328 domain-containing protein [Streptomyces sp. NPDC005805]|uniref:DUF4328 domain-containing protein n=1 Tax=Streptomyces sp. NPDC005805 TaxID=3157068 RepID=UPI0033D7DE33
MSTPMPASGSGAPEPEPGSDRLSKAVVPEPKPVPELDPVPAPGLTPTPGLTATPGLTPTPASPYRPLVSPVGLGRAVVILLALVAVADVLVIGATYNIRRLMASLLDQPFAEVTDRDAELADSLFLMATVAQILLYVASVVVFIVWFHRVRSNGGVFAPDRFTRGPGWAIGGWFIPFAALWIPCGVAIQTWRASRTDPYAADDHEPRTLLHLWWAAFVASWLASRYADRVWDKAESPEQIVSAATAVMAATAVDILAAVLAILFVRRLTRMQHTKALALAGAGAPVPAATAPGPAGPVPAV